MTQVNVPSIDKLGVAPVRYYGVLAIAANLVLVPDTANDYGAKVPTAGQTITSIVGVTFRASAATSWGEAIATTGQVAKCTAYGAITKGDRVYVSTTAAHLGQVVSYTDYVTNGTQFVLGVATNTAADGETVGVRLEPQRVGETGAGPFIARGCTTANVASLAAFTVAGNDGLTYTEGQIVLLIAQTTPAENGPYVVGVVSGGAAPLTRPAWWPTGGAISPNPIEVGGGGTVYSNTSWKATCVAGKIIDTDDPAIYPAELHGSTALVAGTFTITTCPILSLTKTNVVLTRQIANTSTLTVGGYHPTSGGSTGLTAGALGTGACVVQACVADGTINVADVSTLHWCVKNW